MPIERIVKIAAVLGAVLAAASVSAGRPDATPAPAPSRAAHAVPPAQNGGTVVALCDGETTVEVPDAPKGTPLPRGKAQSVANQLMEQWKQKNPGAGSSWELGVREAHAAQPQPPGAPRPGTAPGPSAQGVGPANVPKGPEARGKQDGHTYKAFTERDQAIWNTSVQAVIEQGNKVFHDAQELGGTIGVSCDMCHPNASNTHPETYPKYQTQMGRVVLLRDMINWCIENPVRGKPLADDDPKMKELEAYILAQRRGVALDYGKH